MGEACCECIKSAGLENSDLIDIFSILVNVILTIWIVTNIQDKSANKRNLKDHYINELKEIRFEYKNCLSNLYNNKVSPKNILPWFKLMNIKVNDFVEDIHDLYKVDKNVLNSYQNELRDLISENEDFISQFNSPDKLSLSANSKNSILQFQQLNSKIFNQIILKINNY